MPPPASRKDFQIAIICALNNEAEAVEAAFDEIYKGKGDVFRKTEGDPNTYVLGEMSGHHVVLLQLPGMGKANASNVTGGCRSTFPRIRLGLVVGICGGVPQPTGGAPVFKGDVIVSTYIIQSDFGRHYEQGIERKTTLDEVLAPHAADLKIFLKTLQRKRSLFELKQHIETVISEMAEKSWYDMPIVPENGKDAYESDYGHMHRDGSCQICLASENDGCEKARKASCLQLKCDSSRLLGRTMTDNASTIHFGNLASSDQVMKSAVHRDKIAEKEKVLGFEMEGAGVWDIFPTIVVKSVCDYADSHKDKAWQDYAAARAAATAKAMLSVWSKTDTESAAPAVAEREAPSSDPGLGPAASAISNGPVFSGNFRAGRDQIWGNVDRKD